MSLSTKLDELKSVLADARNDGGHHDFQTMQAERAEYLLWDMADDLIAVAEAAQEVASPCDHSEDARGYCVGHGGIVRLPCPFGDLNDALGALGVAGDGPRKA